jgi:hypothetical protein
MRLFMIAIVILSVGAGASFAQTDTGSFPSGAAPASPPTGPASLTNSAYSTTSRPGASPTGSSPQRQPRDRPQFGQGVHDSAVAECMHMWDSGTHMTKQAWSHTCKRVQTRLDNLNLEAIMATSPKPGGGRQYVR